MVDFKPVTLGLNSLIDAFTKPIYKTSNTINLIAKGMAPELIEEEYEGDFNLIKNNLNKLITVNSEISSVAKDIAEGNLNVNLAKRSEDDLLMSSLSMMVKKP